MSSSSRLFDDRDKPTSDDEGVDEHDLEELEQHEGYELKDLKAKSYSPTRAGAEQYDSDDQDGDDLEEGETGEHSLLSSNQTPSFPYTCQEEAAVKRKLDRNLVLFVAFLYMLSFLDRGNLGTFNLSSSPIDPS